MNTNVVISNTHPNIAKTFLTLVSPTLAKYFKDTVEIVYSKYMHNVNDLLITVKNDKLVVEMHTVHEENNTTHEMLEKNIKYILLTNLSMLLGHFNESIFEVEGRLDSRIPAVSLKHYNEYNIQYANLYYHLDMISTIIFYTILKASKSSSFLNPKILDLSGVEKDVYEKFARTGKELNLFNVCTECNPFSMGTKLDYNYPVRARGIKLYNAIYTSNQNSGSRGTDGSGVGDCTTFNMFNVNSFLNELSELLDKDTEARRIVNDYKFSLMQSFVRYDLLLKSVYDHNGTRTDYSFAKVNNRSLYSGILYPTMIAETTKFIFAIDYSGSISQTELAEQLGVIDGILAMHANSTCTIVVFSENVRKVLDLEYGETLEEALPKLGKNIGYQGGTVFQSVFDEYVEKLSPTDLASVASITIISADGLGGEIILSDYLKSCFKGSVVMLLSEESTSKNTYNSYKDSLGSQYNDVHVIPYRSKK